MKTIHFNTGRKYTGHGQRITATLHDDNVVTYFDHDRLVDGIFPMSLHCQFNQTEVMHWYDAGSKGDNRSWRDAMLKDGCNTKYEGPSSLDKEMDKFNTGDDK